MDDQNSPDISLDKTEDWIVKYRAAVAQDVKRSQPRIKRYRSAIEEFARQLLHHFNLGAAARLHVLPLRVPNAEARNSRSAPDVAHLG